MKCRRLDSIFPNDLSDEAASVLNEFLHHLAAHCESRYFVQLRQYHRRQMHPYDPDAPWRPPPHDLP